MSHETSNSTPSTAFAVAPASLLTIEGPFTVAVAETWRARLLAELGGEGELTVDLSAVTEVDVFGIQLLLSTRRSAMEQGRALRVSGEREALERACVSVGVDRALF